MDASVFWSAAAAVIALVAVLVGIIAPMQTKRRAWSGATAEVLRATEDSLSLFRQACDTFPNACYCDLSVSEIGARAAQFRVALDRLLNRAELSDGAIVTGAGAMQLMDAILEGKQENFAGPANTSVRRAVAALEPARAVVALVEERAGKVARNAIRHWFVGATNKFGRYVHLGLPGGVRLSHTPLRRSIRRRALRMILRFSLSRK
jgi:hypothetical protein